MQATMENPEVVSNEPIDPGEVAAFLEGTLAGEDLKRVEARLADDPAARQEIIKAARIISSAPQPRRRDTAGLSVLVTFAAAAAIAIVFIRPAASNRVDTNVPVERASVPAPAERVNVISPGERGTFGRPDEPLMWHAISGATYRVVVSDSLGQTVYQANTSDTAISIPLPLKGGSRYYWSVDALSPDGGSAPSGVHEFIVDKR
jgi:hypothetical protein